MANNKQTVWFIGEARDRELRFCLREIESLSRGRSIELFASLDDIDSDVDPAVVVVLQDWPKQYREGQINRLIGRIMPHGRLLCVYGSWCESDGRNNADLWPHGVRVAARNAPERFARELNGSDKNEEPLPLTASRDERFEHNHSKLPTESLRRTSAHVVASDKRLRASLEARLDACGVAIHSDARTCDTVMWAPDLKDQTPAGMADFAKEHKSRKVAFVSAMAEAGQVPLLINDRQLLAAVSDT
jgi:hypothetical protein